MGRVERARKLPRARQPAGCTAAWPGPARQSAADAARPEAERSQPRAAEQEVHPQTQEAVTGWRVTAEISIILGVSHRAAVRHRPANAAPAIGGGGAARQTRFEDRNLERQRHTRASGAGMRMDRARSS